MTAPVQHTREMDWTTTALPKAQQGLKSRQKGSQDRDYFQFQGQLPMISTDLSENSKPLILLPCPTLQREAGPFHIFLQPLCWGLQASASQCLHPLRQPPPGMGVQDVCCSRAELAVAGKRVENVMWSCRRLVLLAAMLHAVLGRGIQCAPCPDLWGKTGIERRQDLDLPWRDTAETSPTFLGKAPKETARLKSTRLAMV